MPYKAVLFSSDGDWVTDYPECKTVDEVIEKLADQGSRWIFYPIHGAIKDHGTFTSSTAKLVWVSAPFEEFKGKQIKTMTRAIEELPTVAMEALLDV